MAEKVWLLTEGSYSDYSVVGVIPNEEAATRLAAELEATGGGDFTVEHYDLLTDTTVHVVPHYTNSVTMDFEGNTSQGLGPADERIWNAVHIGEVTADTKPCTATLTASQIHQYNGGGEKMAVHLSVYGTDIERCRKTWSERFARLKSDPSTAVVKAWSAKNRFIDPTGRILNDPVNAAIADTVSRAQWDARSSVGE